MADPVLSFNNKKGEGAGKYHAKLLFVFWDTNC